MTEIGCSMDRVLLEEYADGMLDRVEQLLVEDHVRCCKKCRKELTEIKLLFWEIENIADQTVCYPDTLKILGAKLVGDLDIKPSLRENFGGVLATGKKTAAAALNFTKHLPLARQTNILAKTALNKSSGLAEKLVGKLRASGGTIIKRRLAGILGGAK